MDTIIEGAGGHAAVASFVEEKTTI